MMDAPKLKKNETLGEALPREMARVRDEVIPAYLEAGPGAKLALHFMRADLDATAKALAEGDTVAMMHCYMALTGYKL